MRLWIAAPSGAEPVSVWATTETEMGQRIAAKRMRVSIGCSQSTRMILEVGRKPTIANTPMIWVQLHEPSVSFPLPKVAPNDLTHSNNQHDCAVECPVLVALHEAATEGSPCKIQSLQDPDPSHQNHQDTDKAADYSHHRVEHTPHRIPRMQAYTSRALFSSTTGTASGTVGALTGTSQIGKFISLNSLPTCGRPMPQSHQRHTSRFRQWAIATLPMTRHQL